MNYLAFDFGGTFVKGAVISEKTIIEKWKDKAPLESKQQFKEYICQYYEKFADTVEGIAISMPGIIDSESGYAYRAGSYKALTGVNIYDYLKDIPVKVAIENDGKAATLAELNHGNLKGVKTGAVITVGTGLGGGIVVDGRLHRGSHSAAGEITGFLFEPGNYSMDGTAALNGGMTGFLLKVAKAKDMDPALFEVSDNFLAEQSVSGKKYGGREVLEWVKDSDEASCAVYNEWIRKLIMIILNIQITLDTEAILIGGGISQNEMFIRDLKEEYAKAGNALSIYRRFNCKLDVCAFREDANLIGAIDCYKILYEKE